MPGEVTLSTFKENMQDKKKHFLICYEIKTYLKDMFKIFSKLIIYSLFIFK